MECYFYIARCCDNSLYCGITRDLKNREKVHNQGTGSIYTRIHSPVKIIYFEKYLSRSEAAKREAQVKGWPKKKKEELVKHGPPYNENVM